MIEEYEVLTRKYRLEEKDEEQAGLHSAEGIGGRWMHARGMSRRKK